MITSDLLSSFKDNIAVVTEGGVQYTYGDLLKESQNICGNIAPRSLVFCLANNEIGSLSGYLSFVLNNIVPVMLDSGIDKDLLDKLIDTYQPEYIWIPEGSKMFDTRKSLFKLAGYALLRISDKRKYELNKDLALLLTTSGSTGSPKLVKLTYQNIYSNAYSISKYLEIDKNERAITLLPMHYSFGLSIINSHLIKGATILLTDKSLMERGFWDFLQEYRSTSLSGVPYSFEILNKLRFFKMHLPYLKTITQAGGRLGDDLRSKFARFCLETNKRFFVMYGQTEATARMSYLPADYALSKIGSIGIAIPGGSFSIINENGGLIREPEVVGELVYKGKNVSMGYAVNIGDLKESDTNKGVLKTGDLAKFDEDGFYYIVGRKNRFMKVFGNRINLDEIECLIKSVAPECACSGIDDKIYVYITDSNITDKVKKFISSKTGIHANGFEVRYIDEIPKNSSGKIAYAKLETS